MLLLFFVFRNPEFLHPQNGIHDQVKIFKNCHREDFARPEDQRVKKKEHKNKQEFLVLILFSFFTAHKIPQFI